MGRSGALAVCFLLIPAVLLLQRWQAGPAPEWLFLADLFLPEVNPGTYVRVRLRLTLRARVLLVAFGSGPRLA